MSYLAYLGERLADHPEALVAMCRLAHINRRWTQEWEQRQRRSRQRARRRHIMRARRIREQRRGGLA